MSGNRFTDYQQAASKQAQQANAIGALDTALFEYFSLRRRQVIAELRLIERLLNMPQSIPEKKKY